MRVISAIDRVQLLLLVNPAQIKALAGRKSDGRDAQRIAQFLQDGRLNASFVTTVEMRALRTLRRHRVSLLEQRNEVHKPDPGLVRDRQT